MSNQITTAFVQQFSANITTLSQQQGSILRGAVRHLDMEILHSSKHPIQDEW